MGGADVDRRLNPIDAVEEAQINASALIETDEIEDKSHLMAQKRDNGTWCVVISDKFSLDFLTHFSDNEAGWKGTNQDIVDFILQSWDDDWTDVQKENPAGDFSYGSSDFT